MVVNLTEINYVYKETHVNTAFTLNCIRWVYMCLIYLKKQNKTKQPLHAYFEYLSETNPLI